MIPMSALGAAINIAVGCVVLLIGRNVFWLVVGLVGFLLGMECGAIWFADAPTPLTVIGALALGVAGAVLAKVFERLAFGAAGFFAASFLAAWLPVHLRYSPPSFAAVIAMGVLGAVIAVLIMDWAIILLTALVGAAAIVSALRLVLLTKLIGFAALALLGVVVQSAIRRRRQIPG